MIPLPCRLPGIALAAVSLASVSFAQAIEVPLTFHEPSPDDSGYSPYGSSGVEFLPRCPEGEWKWPPLRGERPLWVQVPLGDSQFMAVIERWKETGRDRYRLHFDGNGNGDLTDDPTIDARLCRMHLGEVVLGESIRAGDQLFLARFEHPFTVEYRLGDRLLPYRLELLLQIWNPDRAPEEREPGPALVEEFGGSGLILRTDSGWRGEFDLGDERYRVMLGDYNGNGRFDDVAGSMPEGALLRLDGDMLFLTKEEEFSGREFCFFGDRLLLGERLFEVRVDLPHRRLHLLPYEGTRVPLTLPLPPEHLLLRGREAGGGVALIHPGETPHVPPGDYRIVRYDAIREEATGDRWHLIARGSSEAPFVAVTDPANNRLPMGEPFTAVAEVPAHAGASFDELPAERRQVPVEFRLEGAGGEHVDGLRRLSGTNSEVEMSSRSGSRPREPRYTVFTSDGGLVTQGTFEYG